MSVYWHRKLTNVRLSVAKVEFVDYSVQCSVIIVLFYILLSFFSLKLSWKNYLLLINSTVSLLQCKYFVSLLIFMLKSYMIVNNIPIIRLIYALYTNLIATESKDQHATRFSVN
jgi:hypothetical protein